MTLTGGLGGATDWLTVAATGAPDGSYGTWIYVGAGITTRTWKPAMPLTPGTYEFRLFANDGYTRLATSPAITVATTNPVPAITSINPSSVPAGSSPFTLRVLGTGFVGGSQIYVNNVARATTFVSTTEVRATVTAGDVVSQGMVALKVVSPGPGGGTSNTIGLIVIAPPLQPTIGSISPTAVARGSGATLLTVSGNNFVWTSTILLNGVSRNTTYVSDSELTTTLPASDFLQLGTHAVQVSTPAPGGGDSNTATLTVTGPQLTIDTDHASPGEATVTMTLSGGVGGAQDWLTVTPTNAANTDYGTWIYVGAGVTSRTWKPPMPTTPGTYEFRLFANNGYTRLATSPTITVEAGNAVPVLTSLDPASVPAGHGEFLLTIHGTGFVPGSVVILNGMIRATYFDSDTQLRATVYNSEMIAPATHIVKVRPPLPGGGLSDGMSFTVTAFPSLGVSGVTGTPGAANVTMTLANGSGTAGDWLALAAVDAPSSTFVASTVLGSGETTKTWQPTMPGTPGVYEFRLFGNNGFTRLATSPAITVGTIPPPPIPAADSVSPSSVGVGGSGLTVSLNGSNLSLNSVAYLNGSPRPTRYVSSAQRYVDLLASDLSTTGARLLYFVTPGPGGGQSNVAMLVVRAPTLTLSSATATPGQIIVLTGTNTSGDASDVVTFARVNSADDAYEQAGSTGGSTFWEWHQTMPGAGTYEFRLYSKGVRVATSLPITVTSFSATSGGQ
jgi:hypothetical protein